MGEREKLESAYVLNARNGHRLVAFLLRGSWSFGTGRTSVVGSYLQNLSGIGGSMNTFNLH